MPPRHDRRDFLRRSALGLAAGSLSAASSASAPEARAAGPVRVRVWDERQPAQKQAYSNFLGNAIADHLRTRPGLEVASVALDDPRQGLSDAELDATEVLVWWGHVRQADVTPETGRRIVARILDGKLSLLAIHSAHWSTPFVEAMYERTRRDVAARYRDVPAGKLQVDFIPPQRRYTVPPRDARPTPYETARKFPDGRVHATVHLPICCFPAFRGDGKPSTLRVLRPDHPIAKELPQSFQIPRTEMYDEPFHVPEPDEVLLEERWEPGEWFRSVMLWNLGKGRVVYMRPGHETFPVFHQAEPLRLVGNIVSWLGSRS